MKKKSVPSTESASKKSVKSESPKPEIPSPQTTKEQPTNGEPLQGSRVILPDVEPWKESVDGAEVLSQTSEEIRSYVALPDGAADVAALWCLHTHVFKSFETSPRLNICSPEKGCGKTTLRDVIGSLVSRPLPTDNLTTAVLFRLVQAQHPTLLADEYDTWLHDREELRGIINAGHKRGGSIIRCVGNDYDPRRFECFAPVILCGIGSLPATIHDRSIVIRLMRAKPGELSRRFDSRHTEALQELCRKIARWCRENASRLATCDPKLPPRAKNRLADNWRPLFAIATIAGGDWPERVTNAFAKLNELNNEDAQGISVTAFIDIRFVFEAENADRLGSQTLCRKLANLEDRPWAEYGRRKEEITTHELARILRPFGIQTRNTKTGDGKVCKAYHLEDFQDAFSRYLPPEGDASRYPATKAENIGDSVHTHPLPTDSNPLPHATGSGSPV